MAKSIAIVAPTLFLIPAVPMVLGGMDILRNHNAIGLARWACIFMMLMTIFLGLAIVVGFTQPALEATEITARPWPWFLLVVTLACAIGSAMLGILFNSPVKYLPLFLLCGATTWGVRALAMHLGWSPEGGTFTGAVASTLLAVFISRKTHVDYVILAMLSVIPMVPGYIAIRAVRGIFALTKPGGGISLSGVSETTHFIFTATLIFLAIILGPAFTLLVADRKSARI